MSHLNELYQEVILDHSKNPRNFGDLKGASHHAEGFNPLCGDRITLYLQIENNQIIDARFEGSGCAISTASASLMTDSLKGKTVSQAQKLFQQFHHLVTEDGATEQPELDKLNILAGVHAFPMRVKCATLAWHTLLSALDQKSDLVSTE